MAAGSMRIASASCSVPDSLGADRLWGFGCIAAYRTARPKVLSNALNASTSRQQPAANKNKFASVGLARMFGSIPPNIRYTAVGIRAAKRPAGRTRPKSAAAPNRKADAAAPSAANTSVSLASNTTEGSIAYVGVRWTVKATQLASMIAETPIVR